ncbi:hypothetical protein [uncultured Algibacter sp.]|uniref:hypothetical protein n=1 Tax=uncultured Algibacter sp. TaxID=298659 RepID=UPI002622F9FC|nr:hypothetical protein [uncultured Algibacter sp.]
MKIKFLIITLLSFSITGVSQTKEEIEAKDFFWGSNDAYKNAINISDAYKNESAVILYKNENYDFHKFGKNVTYKTSIRKRIKLLDKAALDEFSEFSFKKRFRSDKGQYSWRKKGNNIVGIKIIKKDGNEIEIDVNAEAIEVDGEYKLAISNLEVGDIIDYYFQKTEPFKSTYAFGFDPIETTLGEEYPVMDFKLYFETENDFFINFNSYNGAPELKEIPTDKKNFRRYTLEAVNIKKNKFPRWFFPLIEIPSYKFQVYFARSGKFEDRALAFLPEKENIIKKTVLKEEVLELYDNRFKPDGYIGDVKDFFKGKDFKNDEEKVIAAYYYMRHFYLTRYIEAIFIDEAKISYNPYSYYGTSPVFIQDQKQFIKHFTEFLKRHKIDYEIVVAKKRFDGTIDDLLIEKNVNVLLKIKTKNPIYVEHFGPHTCVNQYSPLLEGTDVYLLSASKNRIDAINKGKLPISSASQNENKKEVTFSLNDDFNGFEITTIDSYKGHLKEDQQYERLYLSDYVYEDYSKYETKSFVDLVKRKKDKIKFEKELDALISKLNDKQKEKFKKIAESEYELTDIEDYSFKINSTGRYGLDSYFTYTESFKGKNAFIKKAGPNYIIEIGKLITGQIDLNEEQRNRKENIHMYYPRSYNNEIVFNIPDGYTISGIDKLSKNVSNKTGAFISKAKIENNKLIINTSKYYENNYEPNANWNLMVNFLDAANQFTNEKILLKKK